MDFKNGNILFMEINASIRQQPLDNLESIVPIHNNSDDNHQRGKEGSRHTTIVPIQLEIG